MLGSLITFCAGLTAMSPPPKPAKAVQPTPDLHAIEARVIEKTNSQRVRHGLRPLRVDVRLLRSARRHAAWMTNNRSMVHTTAAVAENIAMGQHSSDGSAAGLDELLGPPGQHPQPGSHPDWRGGLHHARRHDLLVPAVLAVNRRKREIEFRR